MNNDETLLLFGGNIIYIEECIKYAEALAVRDGKVLAVGGAEEVRKAAGDGVKEIFLNGATAMPGLIDTHPHLLHFSLLKEPLVDIGTARNHTDIRERIAQNAAGTPVDNWIMTTPVGEAHYFQRRSYKDLEEGELPDRFLLDEATKEHPVFIQAWAPKTPNVCVFNSKALEFLGINQDTPDRIENVWIEKDDHGMPTGRLSGSVNNYYSNDPFMNKLLRIIPILQPKLIMDALGRGMAEYNQLGVTTIYEGHAMSEQEISAYQYLHQLNLLNLRVLACLEAEPYGMPWNRGLSGEEFQENLDRALAMEQTSDDFFRYQGITLSRGGPCWPGFFLGERGYDG